MTFYNIIFGILFLGACQEVLVSVSTFADVSTRAETGFLILVALAIFNDAVNTAEAIEARGVDYSIGMKLIDLLIFLTLSFALILLIGNEKSFFDVNVYDSIPGLLKHPSVPPALLLVYWLLVAAWNRVAKWKFGEWPRELKMLVGVIFFLLFLLTLLRPFRMSLQVAYILVLVSSMVAFVLYMLSYLWIKNLPPAANTAEDAAQNAILGGVSAFIRAQRERAARNKNADLDAVALAAKVTLESAVKEALAASKRAFAPPPEDPKTEANVPAATPPRKA